MKQSLNLELALALRPKSLDEIIGHDSLKPTIRKRISAECRTWLFTGPTGTGKTTLAYIVGREIQGEEIGPNSKFVLRENNAGNYANVAALRELANDAGSYPMIGKFQVYLLDEAHTITGPAQEVLLKALENTTTPTVWILCTDEPEKLDKALRHRCSGRFRLKGMGPAERKELVLRAAAYTRYEGEPTKFLNAVEKARLTSAREILSAFELFNSGMAASEAVADVAVEMNEEEPAHPKAEVRRSDNGEPSGEAEPEQSPDGVEKLEPVTTEEPLPEFPRLNGPLGRLVDAITPDIPYEHKALCALAYVGLELSGRVKLEASERHLQPRFYACMIGPPGSGKSAAQQEVCRALRGLAGVRVEFSIDSGPALVEALEEHPRLLYVPDEMTDAFQKGRHTKVFGQMLRLYESNETGRRVVKRNAKPTKLTNVHFAMAGTATPQGFVDMWQGTRGGSGGLQSRFVLSYSTKTMPGIKKANDEGALSRAVEELAVSLAAAQPVIKMSWDAEAEYMRWVSWYPDHERFPRVLDMGKRFALALAACNGKTEIDEETTRLSMAFMEYQVAAYKRFMPPDSSNHAQAFEHRIIAFFERRGPATQRDARNNIKPNMSLGGFGAFSNAFGNLTRTGKLKQAGLNRVGTPLWSLD